MNIIKKPCYEKHKIDFFFYVVEGFAIYLHTDSRADKHFAAFTISEKESVCVNTQWASLCYVCKKKKKLSKNIQCVTVIIAVLMFAP